ncbi:hypothetical protein MSAN_02279500 [Mycena sanguinolenta]|uniref:Uncharacterized protein n=1 Tax=Mycena sanguinolenta TaxID=230812 RepID=A0A8H7CH72_9AGAR|nr:hypothetical protein MSAN_02279500 [Mycena sanguinolenta]
MSISLAASEDLVEKVLTEAVMEVLGMVLLYISADPRPRNHPGQQTAFQTIRRGDLKLLKEVRLSTESGVVSLQSRGVDVRRAVYHAKIHGDPGTVTVAVYQGDGAEKEADIYIEDIFGKSWIDGDHPSVWIRSATGELCLDVAQRGRRMGSRFDRWPKADVLRLENVSLDAPDSEDTIISSLSKDQYYELCSQPSITRFQYFQVSTAHAVGLGIFQTDSQYGTCVRITEPLQILPEELQWDDYTGEAPVCTYMVKFTLRIADERDIPEGYLFVCPPDDFRTGTEPHVNLYQWPACPAYWSLDPSGADRLSMEDAKNLGFPAIHIETRMFGRSWDHSVYEGLRRFHEGKGHDPESQEVARQLGYPLYEMLSDRVPFPARKDYYWLCDFEDPELCQELGHFL